MKRYKSNFNEASTKLVGKGKITIILKDSTKIKTDYIKADENELYYAAFYKADTGFISTTTETIDTKNINKIVFK